MVITDDLGILKKFKMCSSVIVGMYNARRSLLVKKCYLCIKIKHLCNVPKGLQMGIGTMSKGEKAVLYVTSQSPLIPSIDGIEEVHFEVELIHFIQVRDVLGDGLLIKRRIRDGKVYYVCITKACSLMKKRQFSMIQDHGQPLEFSSGEGFEMCVRLMLPEEISLITCPPDYAYDKFTRPANVLEGVHVFEMQKNLREFNHVNPQYDEEGKEFANTRMMTIDKSSEANAKAALLKLKQTEQPGEISLDNKVNETKIEDRDDGVDEPLISSQEEKDGDEDEPPVPAPARMGSFSRLWTRGMNLFKSVGINRCSIL
ncbi:hypothetical protein L1987_29438 [Smallanthus sonchifolius]|uniref:Uncharacterized protein n=1 Tax=Smallanthus sonchifolius TaxID=185202 RepID=A0ACB9I026_9ASTR|nr:hypothetical protein L1987_29438 [Smallanthus sonchifolius]